MNDRTLSCPASYGCDQKGAPATTLFLPGLSIPSTSVLSTPGFNSLVTWFPTPGVSAPTFSVPRCPFARVRLADRPDWTPPPATLRKKTMKKRSEQERRRSAPTRATHCARAPPSPSRNRSARSLPGLRSPAHAVPRAHARGRFRLARLPDSWGRGQLPEVGLRGAWAEVPGCPPLRWAGLEDAGRGRFWRLAGLGKGGSGQCRSCGRPGAGRQGWNPRLSRRTDSCSPSPGPSSPGRRESERLERRPDVHLGLLPLQGTHTRCLAFAASRHTSPLHAGCYPLPATRESRRAALWWKGQGLGFLAP